MRSLTIGLALLMVMGCSPRLEAPTRPATRVAVRSSGAARSSVLAAAASAYVASFSGFGKAQDRILGLAPFEGWISDPDVEIPFGQAGLEDGGALISYTYDDIKLPENVRRFPVLFPAGSKYERYQVRWTIICGDYAPATAIPFKFDDGTHVEWGTDIVIDQANPNHVYPQQPVSVKWRGATLTLNSVDAHELNGLKVQVPGGGVVRVAHVEF